MHTHIHFSKKYAISLEFVISEPLNMRQVVTEQVIGWAPVENKTMIQRLSSFQPDELSDFK
jgi:hypothetical protein